MAEQKPDDVTNPNPDGGDAGTQDAGARNAEADANREKLLQTLQEKAARVNAAEAENKTLRDLLAVQTRHVQSPAAQGNSGDPRQERLSKVKAWADGTADAGAGQDPVAGAVLDLMEELRMTQQEVINLREIDRIPDEDKRARIAKHFNENRARLGDVKAARAEVEAEELAARVKAQEEELEKLRKGLAQTARRPDPNVVRTESREVTATELATRKMTGAEWQERQSALQRQADAGDETARKTYMREQVERRKGGLIVEG